MTKGVRQRLVIVGGRFGGLTVTRSLRHADLEIVLIDRTNHHLFQPLLYQVATGALSPSDIAWPLRTALRSQCNVRVLMDEVTAIDRTTRIVSLRHGPPISFDLLVMAPGSRHFYFGHDEWERHAPGLKTLADALELRERLLMIFEQAERRREQTDTPNTLNFVIVGGGPTGVELAGALAEIGRKAMVHDFPLLSLDDMHILLLEGGPRILPGFSPRLAAKAQAALEQMGVTVMTTTLVRDVRSDGVLIGDRFIPSPHVIWAAGNRASPLLESLGIPLDGAGRAVVGPDLTVAGEPWIFVLGDAASCRDTNGEPLPGVAPVAIQQAGYVARIIRDGTPPEPRMPFVYSDRGMLATIGRAKAVAQLGPIGFSGLPAWLLWCVVHIFFLIGFRNRFRVMSEWMWYYVTFKPGARLIYLKPDKV